MRLLARFRRRRDPSHGEARYQERFPETAAAFDRFLARCGPVASPPGDDPVAVVVMPWVRTPVPWYAIALGIGLARRGRPVTFVRDDTPFPAASPDHEREHAEIDRVLAGLAARFPTVRIGALAAAPGEPGDDALVDELTEANVTWLLRGAKPTEHDERLQARIHGALTHSLPRVRTLLREHRFRYAVAPGGVVGPSGLYLAAGHDAGVRVATFDAGVGATAVDVDGVAAQHTDQPRAFRLLEADLRARGVDVVDAARAEFERRRSGDDPDRYQLAHAGARPAGTEGSVLVPLSVMFDAAALGRLQVFPDPEAWLVETVAAVLEETSDPVVVRQHPAERHWNERSGFDAPGILGAAFGSNPQVRFVAAEDDVSTYDLLDASRLVLPFVSTIGIEAAALGKPVVVSGSVYYAGLGFVWAPSSHGEYLDVVRRGARGELPLLPDQVERAWRSYYLTAVCQRVWTNFTPQPKDFWAWVERHPDELYADPDVEDIVGAIDGDVPLPILRHQRRLAAASS